MKEISTQGATAVAIAIGSNFTSLLGPPRGPAGSGVTQAPGSVDLMGLSEEAREVMGEIGGADVMLRNRALGVLLSALSDPASAALEAEGLARDYQQSQNNGEPLSPVTHQLVQAALRLAGQGARGGPSGGGGASEAGGGEGAGGSAPASPSSGEPTGPISTVDPDARFGVTRVVNGGTTNDGAQPGFDVALYDQDGNPVSAEGLVVRYQAREGGDVFYQNYEPKAERPGNQISINTFGNHNLNVTVGRRDGEGNFTPISDTAHISTSRIHDRGRVEMREKPASSDQPQ